MAYNLRYFIPYRKHNGGQTSIHILEKDTSTGTYSTLKAGGNPLVITTDGNVSNLYCGTVGSGADINLRVKPLTMLNLFTTDPQKYMVKIYNEDSLIWQGFISTGIHNEDLNSSISTLLTLKANDGMAILDMIPYRPDASTYYEGVVPLGVVLNRIFSKLSLSFADRRALMDFRVADFQQDLFLYLEVNQINYIDENGKPMSCRKVLDSILNSFGLRMSFRGETVYIVDPINMADVTKGQTLDGNWGASLSNFPGGTLDISLNQIKWYQTGISLDTLPPINELEINYDPYTFTEALYNTDEISNWSNAGSWTGPTGLTPNRYYINNTIQFKNVVTDGSILQQAIKREDGSDQEYYFKLQKNSHNLTGNAGVARICFPLSTVFSDSNLFVKVSADYYCNTRDYNNIFDTSIASDVINYIDTSIGYSVGGGSDASIKWNNIRVTSDYTLNGATITESDIADNWFTSINKWPFGTLPNLTGDGSLNVFISGRYDTGWFTTTDKNVLVKNVKVEIVNANGDTIENSGKKFTALKSLNDYIITPTEIELLHGSGPTGASRGAFRDANTKQPSAGIYRGLINGTGTLYPNSYHVAQSMVSQYSVPRSVLRGELDVHTHLLDTQNYLIKWSLPQLAGKAFFIANSTYNDYTESMSVEMVECASTRENITIS